MPELRLETREDRLNYEPRQMLQGLAGWQLDEPPRTVEIRLSWYTEGKDDRDLRTVVHQIFENAPAADTRMFELKLPAQPYSFSGRLISVRWALELIVDEEHCKRLDLVIAPDGRAIDLAELDPVASGAW